VIAGTEQQGVRTRVAAPSYVQLEPVGQCNLRCQMCPIQYRRDGPPEGPPAFMDFALFARLVDELAPAADHLHLQGLGEPMMHPRFFEMVRYAGARGMRVTTNSNLTLLNERRAEECVRSGLDELHVSIDGATPATYERIRVRARFSRVARNVALLQAARRRARATTPRLHIVAVAMRDNLEELPAIARLAHGWGAERLFVQHLCHDFAEEALPGHYRPMRDFVDGQTLLLEDPARVERWFAATREAAEALGLALRLPSLRPGGHAPEVPGHERCDWPWSGAYVSYDGQAMPCCMVATPDRANFGSVRDRAFVEVWEGAGYTGFRERLASPDPPEICRGCALYHGTF